MLFQPVPVLRSKTDGFKKSATKNTVESYRLKKANKLITVFLAGHDAFSYTTSIHLVLRIEVQKSVKG